MEEEKMIRITDETGNTKEAELVTVVVNPDTEKKYALYTYNPDDDNVEINASEIVDKDGNITFEPVKTPEEWTYIQKEITELAKED